jgi:exonuclease-1
MGLQSNFYIEKAGRGKYSTHNIKQDFEGRNGRKILGVDISSVFHKMLANLEVIRQYHTSPLIPARVFLSNFVDYHNKLTALGVEPFYVFDGSLQPMKHATDESRRKGRTEAEKLLQDLYVSALESDFATVEETQKKAVTMRNDMIFLIVHFLRRNKVRHIQSPFEAEWQLCSLLKHGCMDGILTENSDVFALGAASWITQLNVGTGGCKIMDSVEMQENRAELGNGAWKDHLGAFAVFSGCEA